MEAAILVFGRDGYSDGRIEDIASEAGVSRATFYLHFGGKEDIARAIMESNESAWDEMYRKLNALGDFTWQELRVWIRELADLNEAELSQARLGLAAITQDRGVAAAILEMDMSAAEQLTHYMAQHRQDAELARLRLTVIIEGLFLTLYHWKFGEVAVDEDHMLDALTDVWWAVLRSDVDPEEHPSTT